MVLNFLRRAGLSFGDACISSTSILRNRSRLFVGSPATVQKTLQPLVDASKPDELMVITAVYDHEARKKSYSLLAEAFALVKQAA